ncbi:hypothetical protein diail_394 [Diaporthe ilicicola]|nr:hypothetical protein diail_394 [Diaporthe ilicicola]
MNLSLITLASTPLDSTQPLDWSILTQGFGFVSEPLGWLCVATFLVGFVLTKSQQQNSFRKLSDKAGNRIPDGPRPLPILGSFPFLTQYPELTLDKWATKFGSLYSVWLGNQLFVIISSPQVAKDLMVTHGAVFSSRKEMFIKSQTVFAGRGITATPYNDRWRKHRRIASGWLSQKAVDHYTPVLDYEATDMMVALFEASDGGKNLVNPQPYAGRCSLNNMLTIVFGMRTDSVNDPMVSTALRLSREFMNCTGPMSNLVDFVPLLQYLPSQMRTRGRNLHQSLVDIYGGLIDHIDGRIQSGEEVPESLAKTMLQIRDMEQLDHLDMAITASAFMIGGVETTASIMQWFSALIPAYPEIQRRAQEELDRVVGRDRLPTVADEIHLPYIHAIVKEVERCHNPFWLGTPHVASEDFTYNGKFIPKDTVVVLNTWTMHHDEGRYHNPMEFNPDRYINDSLTAAQSSNLMDPYERDHWMFGAGRRICPGMIVAEREIWLTISRLIWAFTLEQVPGHPIDLREYDGLSGRSPVPFHVRLVPRHENVKRVLDAAQEKLAGAEDDEPGRRTSPEYSLGEESLACVVQAYSNSNWLEDSTCQYSSPLARAAFIITAATHIMANPSEAAPLLGNGNPNGRHHARNGAEPAVERAPPDQPLLRPDALRRPSQRYLSYQHDSHHHSEQHSSHGDMVRDITIGFADGLTVPFALTAGLSSLGSTKLVVIGGLAELFSGMISMGLGAYLAAATERQHWEAEYERERWEVDNCPEREREEIYEVLDRYGISRDAARGVVDELCVATPKGKERWVSFMMDFELQLPEPDTSAAWVSAVTMGLSYFVGGLIPMVPYFILDSAQNALFVSIAITVVILLVFGYVKTWVTIHNKRAGVWGALHTLLIGALAAGTSYLIVRLLDSGDGST